ncbi:MAG: ABC transporter permease [Chthoniobacterales bacterium]
MNDLRFAFRSLLKSPGFSIIVIATLALGIGANAAVFTVVNAILWQKLPFAEPGGLMEIFGTQAASRYLPAAPANFLDWKARAHIFDHIVAYTGEGFVLSGGEQAERVYGSRVSTDFAALLGRQPIIGRSFLASEMKPGRDAVVIISYRLWQRRFGGDRNAIGRQLVLNSQPYTVIGVMPEDFWFPVRPFDLWLPLALSPAQEATRNTPSLAVMARLKQGVSLPQAQKQMSRIAQDLAREHPDTNAGLGTTLTPYLDQIFNDVRPALRMLFAAAGLVLFIACANVANLLLARASARRREFAIRRAVGATRWQIIRLLLMESLLLASLGGALGAVLAVWGVDLLIALRPAYGPLLTATGVNGRVFAFLSLISLLSSVAFGLAPAWQVSRLSLNNGLKEANRATGDSRRQHGRRILVGAEVALAVVLLIGAGLLVQSFIRLAAVRPGFRADHALTISLALPIAKDAAPAQQAAFFQRLIENIRPLPGVKSVGAVTSLPLYGSDATSFEVQGKSPPAGVARPLTNYDAVSPEFFAAMGVAVVKGRTFTERDDAHAPPVVIINETMARRSFPNESAIGKRIGLGTPADWREIVGIVGDVKSNGLAHDVRPAAYVPYLQNKAAYLAQASASMDLVIRTASDPAVLTASIRKTLQRLDKDQPITKIETLERLLNESIAQERFNTFLLASFAALAVVLAGLGIYGLITYTVGQRVQEIGIRMALGAQRGDIVALIVRGTMLMVGLGIVAGLACSVALTRFVSSLLFQVSALDRATYGGVAFLLMLVALFACWFPARRAARVNPLVALRHE